MKPANQSQFKLSDLTQGLEVTIKGDPNCLIAGVSTIQQAQPGHITFLANSLYKKYLADTKASAVILSEQDAAACSAQIVISQNPYYTYAKIAAFFEYKDKDSVGIHPTVVIGHDCEIDSTAVIGPHCVIANRVKIAAHVVIGAACVIDDVVEIGEGTELDAHVTILHHVKIGKRTHIASGVVMGSEGFGFAKHQGKWNKVPQLGGVVIGDDVDIGANTAIDRGAVENTIIENGVKLDNLIQVAHNVHIGENTIIAGCVGIAGSAVIGKNCMIGGMAGIGGHVRIADGVMITGMTAVTKSIHEPGIYSSGVGGLVTNQTWRKNSARIHRLEHLMERVKFLEAALIELTEGKK